MTAFVDTNVVIALLDPADPFHAWSVGELERAQANGPVLISDIVYCEVSVAMDSLNEVDQVVGHFGFDRIPLNDPALFNAGKAFKVYRSTNSGEKKTGVLPDFLIGAIAEHYESALLTANPKDFVRYFPTLKIIAPPVTS